MYGGESRNAYKFKRESPNHNRKDNIKIDLKLTRGDGVRSIHLAEDGNQCRVFVSVVMKYRVPQKQTQSLLNEEVTGFLTSTVLRTVTCKSPDSHALDRYRAVKVYSTVQQHTVPQCISS